MTRSIRRSGASLPQVHGGSWARALAYHRHVTVLRIALVATAWLMAGCTAASSGSWGASPQGAAASTDASGSLQPASLQPSPEASASPGPFDLPASVVDPVVADIARLAALPVDQVSVRSAEVVTFPDAGLGCPVPGMAYTQVQVDGYRIVALAAGTTYDYRGTGPGKFRLCPPHK